MADRLSLPVRGAVLDLPVLFPSVSSLKAPLSPAACAQLLAAVEHPHFLVSAYDYVRGSVEERRQLRDAVLGRGSSAVVLLDSGNYEAYWLADGSWTVEQFENAAQELRPPLAFAFDEQAPPADEDAHINLVVQRCIAAADRLPDTTILPIVHGTDAALARVVGEIARQLQPLMIAVPERALGDSIVDRARTVLAIRGELGTDTPLHLLGTGNPLSIAIFAAAGADSFDGLEWSRTSIDPADGSVHHLTHLPLYGQLRSGEDLLTRALIENLLFFERWMSEVRVAKSMGTLTALILDRVPPSVAEKLRTQLPEVIR